MNRKNENGIERACTFFIIDVFFFYCRHAKFHLSSALFFFSRRPISVSFSRSNNQRPGVCLRVVRPSSPPSPPVTADDSRLINRSRESLAAVPVISAFLFGFFFSFSHVLVFPLKPENRSRPTPIPACRPETQNRNIGEQSH